jgi:transcription elongation factor Elf1
MKTFHCPNCGQKHTTAKVKTKIVCKCGKPLEAKITKRITEVTVSGLTADDFDE